MKFAISSLLQFINKLPEDINQITEQLINLGIEVESISKYNNINNEINNYILEVAVAPNRADLLSIAGIARELAIINHATFSLPKVKDIVIEKNKHLDFKAHSDFKPDLDFKADLDFKPDLDCKAHSDCKADLDLKVKVLATHACPKYLSIVIRDLNPRMVTPSWVKAVLEHANLSLISPIVDITNYVMLELGQPLHAFDLNKIVNNEIIIRTALPNESIELLNNHTINLHEEDLVIADHNHALALAGIMGGGEASITNDTDSILLECAYFEPIGIRKSVIRHNLLSDAAQRFTRNIDPNLQELAIKRCSSLIQEISGGRITSYHQIIDKVNLPLGAKLKLNHFKIKQVLGVELSFSKVHEILINLGIQAINIEDGWELTVPSWRNDLKIQEDIIEELARFIGYNNIIPQTIDLPFKFKKSAINPTSNTNVINFNQELQFKHCLASRGYQEIISYSFIDLEFVKKFYSLDCDLENFYQLKNPISKFMNIMRPSLWPGLITALIYNQNRQHSRVRIFEVGNIFSLKNNNNKNNNINKFMETKKIAGLVNGKMFPENWQFNHDIDFYKLKSDVLALIKIVNQEENVQFVATEYSGLHPYQSAYINIGDINIGVIGALHPELLIALEINNPVYMFELDLNLISEFVKLNKFKEISKFPAIRRDFSILIDLKIDANKIQEIVYNSCGKLLKELIFFDVYFGNKLPEDKKSIAFGVILQHPQRTLIDQEINEISEKIINNLTFIGAQLRT